MYSIILRFDLIERGLCFTHSLLQNIFQQKLIYHFSIIRLSLSNKTHFSDLSSHVIYSAGVFVIFLSNDKLKVSIMFTL